MKEVYAKLKEIGSNLWEKDLRREVHRDLRRKIYANIKRGVNKLRRSCNIHHSLKK